MTTTEGLHITAGQKPTFVEVCERIRSDIRKEAKQVMPNSQVKGLDALLQEALDLDERGHTDDPTVAQIHANRLEKRRQEIVAIELTRKDTE